ncbi:MAG: TraR/DksA family transcriptional regulator [bacterium]
MDQEILLKIKEQLLSEKKKLETGLESFTYKNKEVKGDYTAKFPKFGDSQEDNIAEVAMFSDNLSLEQNLEKALRDVGRALQQIEAGDYGICKYCHQPIDEKRLLARPASSACVACKTKLKAKPRRSWRDWLKKR